jgi:hypothetical protein
MRTAASLRFRRRPMPSAAYREPVIARIGTRTPVLAHDGADLAAALETIREIGDALALAEVVDQAFPGSRVEVRADSSRFELLLAIDLRTVELIKEFGPDRGVRPGSPGRAGVALAIPLTWAVIWGNSPRI